MCFSEYYRSEELQFPHRFGRREWGFMFIGEDYMQRHLAFRSVQELKTFLAGGMGTKMRVPAHVYYSSAYYENPSASRMQDKKWLGADLIFDLDADHVRGTEGMSYEDVLRKVKNLLKNKLLDDFLLGDFGIDEKHIQVVFSGGRGYHIHVTDPRVLRLDAHGRKEIVDCITGTGLDYRRLFPVRVVSVERYGRRGARYTKAKSRALMPRPEESGWWGRMARGVMDFAMRIMRMEEEEAVNYLCQHEGIGKKTAMDIYSALASKTSGKRVVAPQPRGIALTKPSYELEEFEGALGKLEAGVLDIFSSDKALNTFLELIKSDVSVDLVGETDEPVTSDVKRLIRMPTSLHGKTGFKVVPLSIDELDDFEPLSDAVVFSDKPVSVCVNSPVNITLKYEKFNFKPGETMEVPEYAAVFLLCRGLGTIGGWEGKKKYT
jgi:DNA primase small subunit